MIVLDEQLLGHSLEREIAQWYHGDVCFITELRPHTVIKDDAIPGLLQQEKQPTFVTINVRDFWRKVAINPRFCVVCFALPDWRASEISAALRSLFQRPGLKTKKDRMGKVVRVSDHGISYYSFADTHVQTF